jgi:hypothetical protein
VVAAVVGTDLSILNGKTRALVEGNMQPDERVRFCLVGNIGQSIVALDDRLIVAKAGFMAGATFGGRATSFNYSDITGIQVNTGLMKGTIEIHTPGLGATKASDYWSTDKNEDPFKLPNTIPIAKANLGQYQPRLDELRALVAAARTPRNEASASSTDLAGQLAQLKQLLDAGALSSEEFDAAKKRLLNP